MKLMERLKIWVNVGESDREPGVDQRGTGLYREFLPEAPVEVKVSAPKAGAPRSRPAPPRRFDEAAVLRLVRRALEDAASTGRELAGELRVWVNAPPEAELRVKALGVLIGDLLDTFCHGEGKAPGRIRPVLVTGQEAAESDLDGRLLEDFRHGAAVLYLPDHVRVRAAGSRDQGGLAPSIGSLDCQWSDEEAPFRLEMGLAGDPVKVGRSSQAHLTLRDPGAHHVFFDVIHRGGVLRLVGKGGQEPAWSFVPSPGDRTVRVPNLRVFRADGRQAVLGPGELLLEAGARFLLVDGARTCTMTVRLEPFPGEVPVGSRLAPPTARNVFAAGKVELLFEGRTCSPDTDGRYTAHEAGSYQWRASGGSLVRPILFPFIAI